MERTLLIFVITIAAATVASSQTREPKNADDFVKTQLIALEKKAAEAWKNRDSKFFQINLADGAVNVDGEGVTIKSRIVELIASDTSSRCEVKSHSLDNVTLTMFDKNTAILTYKGIQDATCNGMVEPPTVWATALFVKRGGKWLIAPHQETPAVK